MLNRIKYSLYQKKKDAHESRGAVCPANASIFWASTSMFVLRRVVVLTSQTGAPRDGPLRNCRTLRISTDPGFPPVAKRRLKASLERNWKGIGKVTEAGVSKMVGNVPRLFVTVQGRNLSRELGSAKLGDNLSRSFCVFI